MSILTIVVQLFALLFAITIHEASHSWAAMKKGDLTAYSMGRVSLNPLVHIDLFGTILLPLFFVITSLITGSRVTMVGWAKPVPVNPLNLKNPRRDNLWISLAGPSANIITAIISLISIILLKAINPDIKYFFRAFSIYQGTGIWPDPEIGITLLNGFAFVLYYALLINIVLAVFNLIPVPPLDGSGVLQGLLSREAAYKYEKIRPYGFLIVMAIIFLGILNLIVYPIWVIVNKIIFA